MLVDANLLLFATDETNSFHAAAKAWLTERLNGARRVGLPWQTLGAFLRLATHPRVFAEPLTPVQAWARVSDWLASDVAWIPAPGVRHPDLLGELVRRHEIRGNLVPDAQLAALALEHGLTVCSADTDFARFHEIHWENPVGGPPRAADPAGGA
ncbi:MAG: PIN domain-containing protein [Thermoleophilaceae bacterium]|nr:PIN domain-containing protein [Thermoleophilaceae bacterium]